MGLVFKATKTIRQSKRASIAFKAGISLRLSHEVSISDKGSDGRCDAGSAR